MARSCCGSFRRRMRRRRKSCPPIRTNRSATILKSSSNRAATPSPNRFSPAMAAGCGNSSSRNRASKACSCRSPAASFATRSRGRASGHMHSASAGASTRDDQDRNHRAHGRARHRAATGRTLRHLAARGETRGARSRPAHRRRQPAAAVGAHHGDRPPSLFPRGDLRGGPLCRSLHLSAVHLSRRHRAQHHVHLRAVGGVDDLGPRVRVPARDPGLAAVPYHHPAGEGSRRSDRRPVPRLPRARARAFRRCHVEPRRPPVCAGADVSARVRADLARRGDRQPGAGVRGLRGVLQRGDPAALLHVELDLPARSIAHRRAKQGGLSGMAGDARRDQSADLRGRRATRCAHSFPPVRSENWADRAGRHGRGLLPDRAARFQQALSAMNVIASRVRQFAPYVLIFGLLGAVYLLPPDTSLAEVRKAGVLRACMPPSYPPLVTGDRDAPGIDVEMLQALAKNLGVSLIVSSNPAIGQDFNPRNWHVTRAQCEVLGGGVVASPLTKSFLETTTPYAQTGWALVGPKLPADLQGRRVGVLTGVSGLDRLALSSYLRARNAELTITSNVAEFVAGLRAGRFDIGITEWLLAGQLAAGNGW